MVGQILDAVILILYPFIVFVGVATVGVRWTALALLLLMGRRVVAMVLLNRQHTRVIVYQAVLMAAIVGAAALSGSPIALRVAPFVVSLTFIALFAGSLRATPIIERFARLKKPDLPPPEVAYCRALTRIWIAVLTANSLLVFSAIFVESEVLWTILVGPVSYGIIGTVFAIEYPYRKWRFRDFDASNLVDRALARLMTHRPQD